jgi:hypothetical protein
MKRYNEYSANYSIGFRYCSDGCICESAHLNNGKIGEVQNEGVMGTLVMVGIVEPEPHGIKLLA